jgi:hypothetical protein
VNVVIGVSKNQTAARIEGTADMVGMGVGDDDGVNVAGLEAGRSQILHQCARPGGRMVHAGEQTVGMFFQIPGARIDEHTPVSRVEQETGERCGDLADWLAPLSKGGLDLFYRNVGEKDLQRVVEATITQCITIKRANSKPVNIRIHDQDPLRKSND